MKRIFDESYARCVALLKEHEAELRMVADYLLVNESMEGADFAYVCEHLQLPVKKDDTIEPPAKHVKMFSEAPVAPVLIDEQAQPAAEEQTETNE